MQCFTTGDCSRRGGRGGQRSMTQQQGAPETLNDSTCLIYFHRGILCERCDGIWRWSPLVRRGDGEKRGMIFSHGGRENHCVFMRRCREMHDDRKDIYGGPRLGIRLCVWRMGSIYSTISPTCCHCTESSAEDKLAFKWYKWFSLRPALNYQHHDFDYDKWRETSGFFLLLLTQKMCEHAYPSFPFFSSATEPHQTLYLNLLTTERCCGGHERFVQFEALQDTCLTRRLNGNTSLSAGFR